MIDNYQQFRNRYQDMADEELLGLAEQMNDLVEHAQAALRDELETRGLEETAIEQSAKEATGKLSPGAVSEALAETALLADYRRAARRQAPSPGDEAALSLVYSTEDVERAAEIQRHLTDHGIGSQLQVMILVPHADATKAFDALEEMPGMKDEINLTSRDEEEDEDK